MSALDIQIGGGHYREGGIQPVQYIEANGLLFLEASVVKRVTRHNRATGKGRQDIEKAIHELQLLLELRYAEPAPEWPADEQRIDAIGQNGNDGLHYKWVPHPGVGPISVQSGAAAELMHRDGTISRVSFVDSAGTYWTWAGRLPENTDIIAYREL